MVALNPTRTLPFGGGAAGTAVTRGSGAVWTPTYIRQEYVPTAELQARIASLTPTNAELLAWSRRPGHQPPAAWYEETDDPFKPLGE